MDIVLVGLNHRTAPVRVRECLNFDSEDAAKALELLRQIPGIAEVILFSTCNRVEVLLVAGDGKGALERTKDFLSVFKSVSLEQFEQVLYAHTGDDAVRHLYRVASSLDSMVVGEPQILGQIKDAYRLATAKKTSGPVLNRLLHSSFSLAKRVRTETGIGDRAVSVSYAAVELARKIFGDLEGRKVLLVGAGEMAELAVQHLLRNRVGAVFVANRTFERGMDLAGRFKGTAIRLEEIPIHLQWVDIIISSTGAPGFVITPQDVKNVMRARKNRPFFFIDIAVPRDIDPDINKLPNAYVYDIDDLKGVIDENMDKRRQEALQAERMVEEGVVRFRKWMEGLEVVPIIVSIRSKMEGIRQAELKRTFQDLKHLSENDRQAIDRLTVSLVNKALHDPILFLKGRGQHQAKKSLYLDIARAIFHLNGN